MTPPSPVRQYQLRRAMGAYSSRDWGVSVGTGNSQGRLDLRMAEVLTWEESFVAVRRKGGKGEVLEFRPESRYLKSIMNQPVEKLEALCQGCAKMPEEGLFTVRRVGR